MRWTTRWSGIGYDGAVQPWSTQPPPPLLPQAHRLHSLGAGPGSITGAVPMIDTSSVVHLPVSHQMRHGGATMGGALHGAAEQVKLSTHQPHCPRRRGASQQGGRRTSMAGCSQPQPAVVQQRRCSPSPGGGERPTHPAPPELSRQASTEAVSAHLLRQAAFVQFKQQRAQRAAAATLIQAHIRRACSGCCCLGLPVIPFSLACLNSNRDCSHFVEASWRGRSCAAGKPRRM